MFKPGDRIRFMTSKGMVFGVVNDATYYEYGIKKVDETKYIIDINEQYKPLLDSLYIWLWVFLDKQDGWIKVELEDSACGYPEYLPEKY